MRLLNDRATCQEQDAAEHQCDEAADEVARSLADNGSENEDEDESDHGQISLTSFVRELTR